MAGRKPCVWNESSENPPTEEIIGRFHNRRTDQQHDLHDTEPDLEQAAFEQEDRNERQHAGQCQHDAHVDGRLYSLSGRGLQGKGIEPELTRVAREPSQRGKERNGHERRDDEQMECLDSLYHNYLQSFINQILIPVRRTPVDELAQEPRQEQLHAEDHGEDRQVKSGWSVTGRSDSPCTCFQIFAAMIHTVVPPPIRNISVPRLPKKYIGERPKCVMNSTVIRSK